MTSTNTTLPHYHKEGRVGQSQRHWLVVGTVCIGAFMAALDASIVNIALPTLQRQFHVSMSLVSWVSLAYLLTLAAVIVPLGRMADMFGRSWMYSTGFIVFAVSSALCGFSGNLPFLLGARVLQAIGAGMLQANSVSIITAYTPASDRGKAIGFQASAQGIGLSLGPAIGGALLAAFGWKWIFFVNVPVGIIGTILGFRWLPKDKVGQAREKFDMWGTLLLAPTLVSLMYLLNTGVKQGMGGKMYASLAVSVVCFLLFIFVEHRTRHPLINLSIFRNRTFSVGNTGGVLSFAVMYAVIFLVPFFLERVALLSAFTSGLYLTIIPAGMAVSTPFAGMISDKVGSRLPTLAGMASAMVGLLSLTQISPGHNQWWLVAGLLFTGLGLGLYTPPNNASVMGSVTRNMLGVAGGVLNMARTLGMSFGVTAGGLLYELFLLSQHVTEHSASPLEMNRAFHMSFTGVLVLASITLLLAAIKPGVENAKNDA
ncbi:MFS transporter [Alicyclobacillus sp. SO9]|uniref:MFS transporter n=1 Tax=Alicyclobacillus sp. SO9 TaxID=2665646 RepID=UPI0018E78902|nr:MFS transporter [Alicyclobacillus sp. SO9]QQE77791.1 MFS transporter [Alicyclobacillus sp. SO9]